MALERDTIERITEARRRLRGQPIRLGPTARRRGGSAIYHRDLQRARERLEAASR